MIRDNFDSYVGSTAYEELARQRLVHLGDGGGLPFAPDYVGRAFTRKVEIDVVAVGWQQRCVLLGECRWRNTRMTEDVLDGLIERSSMLAGFRGFDRRYALFSKSGFTAALERRAAREHVDLYAGAELDRLAAGEAVPTPRSKRRATTKGRQTSPAYRRSNPSAPGTRRR